MADVVLCSGDISPRGKIQVMCTQIMPPRGVELARLQPCFAAKISVVVPVAVSRPSPSRALCGLASQSIVKSSVRRSLHGQLSINSTNVSQLFT